MILTPDEARTKVCPLMSCQYGSSKQETVLTFCLADGCMKWRWADHKSPAEAARWDPLKTGAVGYCGA